VSRVHQTATSQLAHQAAITATNKQHSAQHYQQPMLAASNGCGIMSNTPPGLAGFTRSFSACSA